MTTSSELYVLLKVAELARRYGIKLSDAEASIRWEDGRGEILSFPGTPSDKQSLERYSRMTDALGIDEKTGEVFAESIDALNEKLDKALSLAPRARSI